MQQILHLPETKIKNQMIDSGRRKLGSIIGDSVKTGINSSFSPGVKVAKTREKQTKSI
jgi:NDP-sugar pyrophosphorylase family protein